MSLHPTYPSPLRAVSFLLLLLSTACPKKENLTPIPSPELLNSFDAEFLTYLDQSTREMGKEVLRYEDISPGLLPKKVTIEGSHYELGYLLGLIADKKFGPWTATRKPEDEAINQAIMEMYRRVCPDYLELVSGVAEARGFTLDDLDLRHMEYEWANGIWWYLLQYEKFVRQTDFSCSLVSYYREDESRHLVGRNFDNQSDRPHFLVRTRMEGRYEVLGNTCYAPYHWAADGMNEKGLFIGVSTNGYPEKYNQPERTYPDVPAVQVIHMVRIALETCTTVAEAIDLFRSVRIWFPVEFNHLLLADAAGDAAVLEFSPEAEALAFRRTSGKDYLVLTNTAYQEGPDFVANNCWRYRTATPMLEAGLRTGGDMLDVMQAIRFTSGETRTLWSAVFDLSTRTMDVRYRQEGYGVAHREKIGD